jgi:hypothetical protein
VEGTHPLAGRCLSKRAFFDATFGRLIGVLSDGVRLDVERVFVDGGIGAPIRVAAEGSAPAPSMAAAASPRRSLRGAGTTPFV